MELLHADITNRMKVTIEFLYGQPLLLLQPLIPITTQEKTKAGGNKEL